MAKSNHELAIQLGLKPFSELEAKLNGPLRRVESTKRRQLIEKIYALAVQQVVMNRAQTTIDAERQAFEEKQNNLQSTRRRIEIAIRELVAAEQNFHNDLPTAWLDIK